jgi:hypothetical protein
MKIRLLIVVLTVVFTMVFTISSAFGETNIKSLKRMLLAYLIDDYIKICRSKGKLSHSRSKHIRQAAALSTLKAEYLKVHKRKLIDEMMVTKLAMKKYKVRYFLNAKFNNYYASQQEVFKASLTKPPKRRFFNT